jgi:hypothetical protein
MEPARFSRNDIPTVNHRSDLVQDSQTESTLLAANRATPTSCRTTRDLTDAQRWLLRIMSECQFGRIENLCVQGGQPVPDRCLKIVRVTRLGANGGSAPVPAEAGDFELKQAIRDLFDEFSRIGDGVVHRLEFRYGLPFQVETTDNAFVPQSGVVCDPHSA